MGQASAEPTKKFFTGGSPEATDWSPYEWDDPIHGHQVIGETAVIRDGGTMGTHVAGFWRSGPGLPGCGPDGSCRMPYSAAHGDETIVVLEGEATITVTATGRQHHLTRGSILCHPKNVDLVWDITSPSFKRFTALWDSAKEATPMHDVIIGNIDDNPETWAAYQWDEPAEGPQVAGELYFVRATGSTGTLLTGIWRCGPGVAGSEADGSLSVPYTSPLGDETELILEGRVHVRDSDTGEEREFGPGDIIGVCAGHHVTWSALTPVKKLWVITHEQLPTG
jgi:uncharacterized cupin superfamily protein